MKNLVFLQILVYLFFAPLALVWTKGEDYTLSISMIFLVGFLLGVFLARYLFISGRPLHSLPPPAFTKWVQLCLMIFTVLYIYTVVINGLTHRRLGSEVVAEMAASMPIYFKLIMRVYEIVFYPVVFVLLSNLAYRKQSPLEITLLIMLFSGFLFTGVLDSRMKLIFPIFFYYVFFIAPKPVFRPIPKRFFLLSSIVLVMLAAIVAMSRIQSFSGIGEYILNDFVIRLDGIQLITRVDREVDIPPYGTLDVNMWSNLIAMIPFLDEARALKAEGLTSTKSYFLQVVLGTKQFDSNNSLVTDLYYFGGYFLTFFGAMLFGYLVTKIDWLVKFSGVWKSKVTLAFTCSFFMNGWQLENGYSSVIVSTARDFCILYLLFFGLRFSKLNRVSVLNR